MEKLETIGEHIRQYLEEKNTARDRALQHSRTMIRHCSIAIRAVHRDEREMAKKQLDNANDLLEILREGLASYPDLYHAGYIKGALKEYAEANIVYALVGGEPLPEPDELGVRYSAYLGGLGEAVGELRRRVLDILRCDHIDEAERLLTAMDDIYGLLVTIDFPDAITGNLRRITDMVRGVTERTRGDLTTSLQQRKLREVLERVEKKLNQANS
ncbi:MAG: haloacid dehalogenase [Anaerolineales bacterium]|jgi:translin|nr:MAG: haloacid dehalogenase [Anaerolineales bacterium]